MTRFLAAVDKELRLFRRDWHALFALFVMPISFMLIMSLALHRDPGANRDGQIILAGMESNPVNQALAESLQAQQFEVQHHAVAPRPLNNARLRFAIDHEEWSRGIPLETLKEQLRAGTARLIIYNPNPADISLAAEQAVRLLVRPGTDPHWLHQVRHALQQEYTRLRLKQLSAAPGSTTHSTSASLAALAPEEQNAVRLQRQQMLDELGHYLHQLRFDEQHVSHAQPPRPSSTQHSVPAWLVFGMFFILVPLANVITVERRTNTLVRLRLAQAPASLLLASKLLPYFLINQLQFIGMVLLGQWLLPLLNVGGIELPGPMWLYALLSCAISVAALGYGLLISVLARTTAHAMVLGGASIVLLSALGGVMVPLHVMPAAMQTLALISPMSWALHTFNILQLDPDAIRKVLPYIALLLAFGTTCLTLASSLYSKQLRTQVRF